MTNVAIDTPREAPWYRQVNATQWNAFFATFLGWTLDGFDFTILTFLIADIQKSFTVNAALAGALGTITLFFRVVGGSVAGSAADRWGRKPPLIASILWYSLFAFLCGFSTSYAMLFVFRALFGIGMGGVWASGMPLTLEHWPAKFRSIASGMLQAGYSTGFILSSLAYQFVYPVVNQRADFGWRVMFWIGVLPALLVLFIIKGVKESPVWLERQRHLQDRQERDPVSFGQLFRRDLLPVTLQTSLLMTMFIFSYYSITFWYPTLLSSRHLAPLTYMLLLNGGGVAGAPVAGWLAESPLGRRGAATIMMLIGVAAVPLYVLTSDPTLMWVGAFGVGLFGAGAWGVVPSYLNERFPTATRAVGAGFAYHVGAAAGSITPTIIGVFKDRGMPLSSAMGLCIAVAGVLVIIVLWLGPETRGREFHAEH